MNRTCLRAQTAIVASLLAFTCAFAAESSSGSSGNPRRSSANGFTEPAWLSEGIVFVGNWEPLDFRIRSGGQGWGDLPVNIDALYQEEHSEQTVERLKAAGVNLVITHFYKTGLKSDHDDIELTKRFVALCHQHGIRVAAYVGGTIFPELLIRDDPHARQWVSYDEYGVPVRYGRAYYRYIPDFNHPDYVEHMKEVVRAAVQDAKIDMIHFDNMSQQAPPNTTCTPEVNRRFREFLQHKYSPEQLKSRFGFSDISALSVPTWHETPMPAGMAPIDDPLIQEWIDFRCQDFGDYYGKLADYIRSLNPNVVVECNPHGIFGSNRAFANGIDHTRLVTHGSVFWSEEQNEAGISPTGILVSKIRSLKLARSLDQTLFVYTGPARAAPGTRSYRLLMAESMAFNRNSLGDLGAPLDVAQLPADLLHYVQYYHEQNAHYRRTQDVADVAILRAFPSMAYNSLEPHLQTTLMEQLLIQYKIPFRIIFDRDLADLSRYKAVILADQESLSDQQMDQIRAYVKHGGGVLATGDTSRFTEWRRRRLDYGLADLLGIHVTDAAAPTSGRRSFGAGRVAYIRDVTPAVPVPKWAAYGFFPIAESGFGKAYWALPKNSAELISALRYAAGGQFSVEFDAQAPLTTVMNYTENEDGTERVVHWVNYALGRSVAPAHVSIAIPAGREVEAIHLVSPDHGPQDLKWSVHEGRVLFDIPGPEVYEAAAITFNHANR